MNERVLLLVILFVGFGDTVNGLFTCQQQGTFANNDASDCKSYIFCDSKLQPTIQFCPGNYFWPSHNMCFNHYDCATNSTPYDTNPCAGLPRSGVIDKTSTDCSSYIYCVPQTIYNSDYSQSLSVIHGLSAGCEKGSSFRPDLQLCTSGNHCVNYQCVNEGYFQIPNTDDCSNFIICSKYSNNNYGNGSSLYPYLATCPENTSFSPFSRKCDEFYTCGGNDPWNGVDPCLNYNWANPFAANPHVNDCTTYLGCQYYYDDIRKAIDVIVGEACPPNTFFSPIIGKCYYNYECNQTCSKDPCGNGAGKFVDYKSGYCQGFIECRDDSTISRVYEPTYEQRFCPPGALFSNEISKCDRDYVCPKFSTNYCYPIRPTTSPPTTTVAPPTLNLAG